MSAIFKKLNFSQKDCPHSLEFPTKSSFLIKNKIGDIELLDYCQANINLDVHFEWPSDLTTYFEYCFKKAKEHFKSEDIYFIKPTISQKISSTDSSSTYLLPSIFTVATLKSSYPIPSEKNRFLHASMARVAWWQNSLGLPDKEIVKELEVVPWCAPHAYSYRQKTPF